MASTTLISLLTFARRSLAHGRHVALGLGLVLVAGAPARADDTEIFTSRLPQARPNILFILDTSGSMNTTVQTQNGFDPAQQYSGSCERNVVYWRMDIGTDPDCNNGYDNWFQPAQLVCDAAAQALQTRGIFNAEFAAQWDPATATWVGLDATVKDQPVECAADAGRHGPNASSPEVFAADTTQWTSDPTQQFLFDRPFTDRDYVIYSGNYLNWLASGSTGGQTRLQIMQDVASNLVQTVSGVNVGLMRYSNNGGSGELAAEGGMVTFPITPIETARNALEATIRGYTADGFTPLSETLFEAYQYFSGGNVVFGANSVPMASISTSRVQPGGTTYLSPSAAQCQENFIVYLTDGLPTRDNSADVEIERLTGTCDGTGPGRCLDDLAGYMRNTDLRDDSIVPGEQTVTTYTVGFGPAVAGSALLAETASQGGGEAFSASDTASLTRTLTNIVTDIQTRGTTFSSPAVAVNSFNRTETLSDLYISVFEPGDSFHWAGNLKKYRLLDGEIADADGQLATDAQGFFADTARSFWSASADGAEVREGGAADQLTATRNVYTFLGTQAQLSANPISDATDQQLGLDQPGAPSRADLLNWARGADVRNSDNNPATAVRKEMGDPLHGRPAIVIYGGTATDPEAVIYVPTNDGYLHAIDSRNGRELWAFIPVDQLRRLPGVFADTADSVKHYGLDGDVRAFKTDENRNGIVDGNDRVQIVFGMRRGGSNYYSLERHLEDESAPPLDHRAAAAARCRPDLVDAGVRARRGRQRHAERRQAGADLRRRIRHDAGQQPGDDALQYRYPRQPHLHGRCAERQSALVRGRPGRHRYAQPRSVGRRGAEQDEQFDSRGNPGDRSRRRHFRRPDVRGGHRRARVALRHHFRRRPRHDRSPDPGCRRPRDRRRDRIAGQCRRDHPPDRVDAPLLSHTRRRSGPSPWLRGVLRNLARIGLARPSAR